MESTGNVFGMYMVLAIFVAFIAMILSGKVKIHLAALCIPIFLEITGVLTFSVAWGGLLTSTVIMMACMFVVGAALGKTSILGKLSNSLIKPGASDRQIMIGLAITAFAMCQVTNAAATITIMLPLVKRICAEHKRPCPSSCGPWQYWRNPIPVYYRSDPRLPVTSI